jgi:glycosyltransferase involved in cell wall biosynthesis
MSVPFANLQLGLLTYGLDRPPTGIGRYTIELISAIAELGVYPTLLGGSAHFLPDSQRYRRVSLPGARLLPGLITMGNFVIHRAVRQAGVQLVHDPTGNPPFLFGAGNAKTVVTVHDVFAHAFPGSSTLLENLITRFWLPLVLPRVDSIITDSQASKRDIIRYLAVPEEKVHVIYLACKRGLFPMPREKAASVVARYRLEPGYLLMVGSLDKRRNLPRLLEAYGQLCRQGEHRRLVIVGKHRQGRDRRAEMLAKFGLQGKVHFLGYVSPDDINALYSAADLFVFPSLYEGFGLPPLEAMTCGTPVVCANNTSLPEVVGDAAVLVNPYNVDALAECIQCVLADTTLQADLRARGLKRAAEFSWGQTAQQTLGVYRQVIA